MAKSLFWADQIAKQILDRKSFHYTSDRIRKPDKYVVKTSASLSGVLHIGRLSDTIRGESVFRALRDSGAKAELIWVAENMDPLRKVPKGVPESYGKYIGMPVTDIPDPFGCHKSYAEHYIDRYFRVLDDFVQTKMKKYSMREEYRKGSFRTHVKKIIDGLEDVIKIQNKYRSNPLPKGWSPWQPICEQCGKIITTHVTKFEGGKAHYKCEDYHFSKSKASGCGYEGINDPLKGNGKLAWKSEWAAQWAHWKVCSEGAGKEYQVPMSAWWVNGEIVERVLNYPMPQPIFYEHIMIDGEKMSASKGNIVYPAQWLEVAPAELLKFFYNKKLMKTRSFSWSELPRFYDDYDRHEKIYFDGVNIENPRERDHMKRLYEISQLTKPRRNPDLAFSFAVMLAQTIPRGRIERVKEILKETGHIKKLREGDTDFIKQRLSHAKVWAEKYAPEECKFELRDRLYPDVRKSISNEQMQAVKEFTKELAKKDYREKELYDLFWNVSEKTGVKAPKLFQALYLVLLGKERGPKLAPFILAVGKKKIAEILKNI